MRRRSPSFPSADAALDHRRGFAGALADRYDRRKLLILANAGFVMTSGLLLASFASGRSSCGISTS